MCAVGDLHRVHDFTQAQRADRSTRVLQRFSTPCQRSCSAHRQSNEIAAFHAYTSHCRRTRRIAHMCLVLVEIHSAQINQGGEILQGPWCAHLRQESKKEGDDLHHKPRIACCAFRETQSFSRVSVTRCSDTQLCQLAQQSTETAKLLKGHRRRTAERCRWVAAQKTHNSIWQGKPACWG